MAKTKKDDNSIHNQGVGLDTGKWLGVGVSEWKLERNTEQTLSPRLHPHPHPIKDLYIDLILTYCFILLLVREHSNNAYYTYVYIFLFSTYDIPFVYTHLGDCFLRR
jgi:hypothetical protein